MCKVSFLSGPCVMAECCSTTFPPRVAVLILGIVNMMRYCAMIMLWVCVQLLSCVQLFETLWTVTHQAPLSLGFSRQEYLSGLPCPPPGDLPDPWVELTSLVSCIGVLLLQLCLTLCSPMYCSLPGSSLHGLGYITRQKGFCRYN